MTNKLVVIINSLKYQKLRKFAIWNEISCTKLQLPPEPLTRGLPPTDPRSLCPQMNVLDPPPEQNSWVRHCPQRCYMAHCSGNFPLPEQCHTRFSWRFLPSLNSFVPNTQIFTEIYFARTKHMLQLFSNWSCSLGLLSTAVWTWSWRSP